MKSSFEIDYKRNTIFLDKKGQKKFISLASKEIKLIKITQHFKIFKTLRHFNIDRKIVSMNLIKILGEDGIYYSTLEYIPEYRAYDVFNQ